VYKKKKKSIQDKNKSVKHTFLRKLESWTSIETTIKDYFTLNDVYAPTSHTLYNSVLQSLDNLSKDEVKIKKKKRRSKGLFHQTTYILFKRYKQTGFFEEYENLDREIRN
jgi:hypothetical protein